MIQPLFKYNKKYSFGTQNNNLHSSLTINIIILIVFLIMTTSLKKGFADGKYIYLCLLF